MVHFFPEYKTYKNKNKDRRNLYEKKANLE